MGAQDESLATIYATALLDLAWEKGVHREVLGELQGFADVLGQDERFAIFLNTPNIIQRVKKDIITRAFGSLVSDVTLNFIMVVLDKRRQFYLTHIIEAYEAGYHDRMGELVVKVATAVPLGSDQRERLARALKQKFQKEVILRERVNERLLGGLVMWVGDSRIDGSLRTRLETVGERLERTRFRSEEYYG